MLNRSSRVLQVICVQGAKQYKPRQTDSVSDGQRVRQTVCQTDSLPGRQRVRQTALNGHEEGRQLSRAETQTGPSRSSGLVLGMGLTQGSQQQRGFHSDLIRTLQAVRHSHIGTLSHWGLGDNGAGRRHTSDVVTGLSLIPLTMRNVGCSSSNASGSYRYC